MAERQEEERRLCKASEDVRESVLRERVAEDGGCTSKHEIVTDASSATLSGEQGVMVLVMEEEEGEEDGGRVDARDRREELSSSGRGGVARDRLATLVTVRKSLAGLLKELEVAEELVDVERLSAEVDKSEKIITELLVAQGRSRLSLRQGEENSQLAGWMEGLREGLLQRSTRQDLNLLRYTRPLATGVQKTLFDAMGGIIEKYDATAVSHGKIGWLEGVKAPREVTDGTAEFYRTLSAMKRGLGGDDAPGAGAVLPSDITYILVPGLFSRHYYGYYQETLDWFRERGLPCIMSGINSNAGVEANAKVLRDEVLDIVGRAVGTDHQVLLVGHSKGGLDSAAALSLYPEIKRHVAGLVCVQAPYGGSPIASDILSDADVRGAVATFLRSVLAGDLECVEDLSHDVRQKFLELHPLPDDVPCVCFHSGTRSPNSLVSLTAQYIRSRYGEESDGLVARRDAEVPGCTAVRLREEMDHSGPVFPRILKIWHGEGNGNGTKGYNGNLKVVPGVGTTRSKTNPQWSGDSTSGSGDEPEGETVAPGAPQLHEALAIMCLRRSGRLPAESRLLSPATEA